MQVDKVIAPAWAEAIIMRSQDYKAKAAAAEGASVSSAITFVDKEEVIETSPLTSLAPGAASGSIPDFTASRASIQRK
jgi:hypothetical protein